jgi:hypothetical protein
LFPAEERRILAGKGTAEHGRVVAQPPWTIFGRQRCLSCRHDELLPRLREMIFDDSLKEEEEEDDEDFEMSLMIIVKDDFRRPETL